MLTPHDADVFRKMTSDDEHDKIETWITNWNRQDWWDIDFGLIRRIVNKAKKAGRKNMKEFEKELNKQKGVTK